MDLSTVHVRRARVADLPNVVALFKLPEEGNRHDLEGDRDPFDQVYVRALEAMTEDNALHVADLGGEAVGVFQLTFIRHVGYQGGLVAQIENVVVSPGHRGVGIGEKMMRFAIEEARRRRAFRVQLTSNKRRGRAHGFYRRLGFAQSHEGMKLDLSSAAG